MSGIKGTHISYPGEVHTIGKDLSTQPTKNIETRIGERRKVIKSASNEGKDIGFGFTSRLF